MAVSSVEEYIAKHSKWKEEITVLRDLLLSSNLEETIKWGGPAYMFNGKNVVGIGAFKNHCALWFFQGALLKENTALLHKAQEEKTGAMRQIRFEKGDEIQPEELKKYISEAIRHQKEGKTIKPVSAKETQIPLELEEAFEADEKLKLAFQNLSPGKQREYVAYITNAKREATRKSRLKKIIPMIKKGSGLNDKYRK